MGMIQLRRNITTYERGMEITTAILSRRKEQDPQDRWEG